MGSVVAEIVHAVLKTQIKCEHFYEVAEIAGTIFAESSEQDLKFVFSVQFDGERRINPARCLCRLLVGPVGSLPALSTA
jgi:hypothetical protein